jgi:hypothetical protein
MRLGVGQGVNTMEEQGESRSRPERLAVYAAVLAFDLEELCALAGYPVPPAVHFARVIRGMPAPSLRPAPQGS